MALDPNIALQVTVPSYQNSPMAGITQGISNANTIQNIATAQAQQPGIEATSAMLQRQNTGQQWLQSNAAKYIKTDADGNRYFDSNAAAAELANAGHPEMATQLASHYLNNEVLKTSSASDRLALASKLSGTIASIAGNMPDGPQRDAAVAKYIDAIDSAGYVPGTNIKMGKAVGSQFLTYDKNGQPIKNPDGTYALNDLAINAARMSTVPVDTQETIRTNQLADHTTQDSLRLDSPISKSTQALAIKLGLADKNSPPQTDYYWQNRPDFQTALKNNAPSASFIEQQKAKVLEHGANARILQSALDAANNANLPNTWQPGVALSNWLQTKGNDPRYGAFVSLLQEAKKIDPTIDETKQDGPTILAKLQGLQKRSNDLQEFYGGASLPGPSPVDVSGLPSATVKPGVAGAGQNAPRAATVEQPAAVGTQVGPKNALNPPEKAAAAATKPATPNATQPAATANHSGKTATEDDIKTLMTKFKLTRDQVLAKLKAAGVNTPGK